ncbi:hypothetical protein [Christiangramia echinicola]|uniref:S9 family peptidase n=1 Tax=Christiangramia echinicola TaxID=279359 RepID=A0A1H1L9Y8_9FLAO|nr:hypothetical protein [Christiangramia echinicola]SDR71303.1 hypothetical protein SAMN04488552_0654 [Christiangramia echinicola]
MKNPFSINFKIISEIRHGSAYNIANLIIEEDFPFQIKSNDSWQDKYSWSPNKDGLVLIKWDIKEAQPRFKIYTFDLKNEKLDISDQINGCCHKIKIRNDLTSNYEVYTLINEKEFGFKSGENKTGNNNG